MTAFTCFCNGGDSAVIERGRVLLLGSAYLARIFFCHVHCYFPSFSTIDNDSCAIPPIIAPTAVKENKWVGASAIWTNGSATVHATRMGVRGILMSPTTIPALQALAPATNPTAAPTGMEGYFLIASIMSCS